jgi:hypothetical protein
MNASSPQLPFSRRAKEIIIVAVLGLAAIACSQSTGVRKGQQATPHISDTELAAVRVSDEGADAAEPAIAVLPDGTFVVAFVTHNADKSADLFAAKLDRGLGLSGESVRINPNRGEVKSWYGDPPAIAVSGGAVYIGWTQRVPGTAGTNLLLSVSRDGGQSFEKPVKVNDDKMPASHGMHSLAADGEKIYMSWLDERNVKFGNAELSQSSPSTVAGFEFVKADHNPQGTESSNEAGEPNSEVFFAASSDGGRTFSKNIRVAGDVCPCCKTATLAAGGKLYLSWRQVLPGSLRHIAVASSSNGGQNFSKAAIVSDDNWMLSACPVSGPAISADEAGELSVYWYTAGAAGEPGLYEARSADNGRTFGPRKLIDGEAVSGTPALLTGSGGTACVLTETGQQIAVVPTTGGGQVARKYANAELPAAAVSGDNAAIVFVRREQSSRSVWITR